jgi:hypothetical protein
MVASGQIKIITFPNLQMRGFVVPGIISNITSYDVNSYKELWPYDPNTGMDESTGHMVDLMYANPALSGLSLVPREGSDTTLVTAQINDLFLWSELQPYLMQVLLSRLGEAEAPRDSCATTRKVIAYRQPIPGYMIYSATGIISNGLFKYITRDRWMSRGDKTIEYSTSKGVVAPDGNTCKLLDYLFQLRTVGRVARLDRTHVVLRDGETKVSPSNTRAHSSLRTQMLLDETDQLDIHQLLKGGRGGRNNRVKWSHDGIVHAINWRLGNGAEVYEYPESYDTLLALSDNPIDRFRSDGWEPPAETHWFW